MRAIATLAFALAATPAFAAGSLYDSHFAERGGAWPCYARTYDKAHLSAHPDQKVRQFFATANAAEGRDGDGAFYLAFGFVLRDSDERFSSEARCTPRGDGAACQTEGDGGSFTLAPRPDGVLLEVDDFLAVEGPETFSPDLAESDDRAFRLYPSEAGACAHDWGDPGGSSVGPSLNRPG
ncbi:MAG: hypothetical protein KDK07_12985 [Bauldia sp.]|nr:hypothetical protein [Bauldia sp.]